MHLVEVPLADQPRRVLMDVQRFGLAWRVEFVNLSFFLEQIFCHCLVHLLAHAQ